MSSLQDLVESLTGSEELAIARTFGMSLGFMDGWHQRRAAQFRHPAPPRP